MDAADGRLPIGTEAFLGREYNDLVLGIESVAAVVSGDTLVDFGRGLEANEWLRGGVTPEEVTMRLRPLLALPKD
jgi:predicted methyltransferase MtxX (methanogen marker protein 4)